MTSCSGLSGLHDGPLIRPTKRNGRVRPYADTCCAVVAVGNVWLQSRSATEINTECDGKCLTYLERCYSFTIEKIGVKGIHDSIWEDKCYGRIWDVKSERTQDAERGVSLGANRRSP
ncbi:uncharacterized protein LOC144470102 isoform X2 [Augochlora pura]